MAYAKSLVAICLIAFHLVACGSKEVEMNEQLPPFDERALAFSCVREADHLPPIKPEAEKLYQQARSLQKAPGPKNFDEIAMLYSQAGELGHWKALQNLQVLYYQGLASHPRPQKAVIDINEQLIKLGAPIGYYNMATYLEEGYGVRQDMDAALAYYRKSADLGNPNGQAYVGKLLAIKLKKFDVGVKMLECAVAQGSGQAAFDLSEYFRAFRDDDRNALVYLHRAASFGHELAAFKLRDGFARGPGGRLSSTVDAERSRRYRAIEDEIGRNPYARFPDIDKIVPLPPAPLPKWDGTFEYKKQR